MPLTVRISHYPTYTPLIELEVDPSDTVGALKAMVEERLAAGEEGMMKVIPSAWHLISATGDEGTQTRKELLVGDDSESVGVAGISDYSTIHVEGPSTETIEGIGSAFYVVTARLQQTQTKLAERDIVIDALLQRVEQLASGQRMLEVEVARLADINRRQAEAWQKEKVLQTGAVLSSDEDLARTAVVAQEATNWDDLSHFVKEGLSRLVTADEGRILLARFPKDRPLQAFWCALSECTLDVAMFLMKGTHHNLINTRTQNADGKRFINNWAAGVDSTPLMLAAHANRLDVVKALVENGAEVDAVDTEYGYSALHVAAADGHSDILQYLAMDAKANRRLLTKSGKTAAQFYESLGKQKGASPNHFALLNFLQK